MRRLSCAALAVGVYFFVWQVEAQSPPSTINVVLTESKIQAVLRDGATVVSLPFEVNGSRPLRGNLTLEWLRTDGSASGTLKQEIALAPGRSSIEVSAPLPYSDIFLRLRYSLTPPINDPRAFTPQGGVVALSQIAAHAFEVKLGHTDFPLRGTKHTIHAQAIQAGSRLPLENVSWKGILKIDGKELPPIRMTPLGAGYAELVFDVPQSPNADPDKDDESEIIVTGRMGDFESSISSKLRPNNGGSVRLQTDKPIYQPEQAIHVRAVVLDAQGHAAAGRRVRLVIQDPRNDEVHTANLVSSRFGVVSGDWTLPANAELGNYQITIRPEGQPYYRYGTHVVKVSRYELPTFRVTTELDRPAYLLDQAVSVKVRGEYLFGKPVPNGKVKVTRIAQPKWNAKLRKFDYDEDPVGEGVADNAGNYSLKLEVAADQKELAEREDDRFKDLNFAAYYTDPTSGRTEQRKFDVRISREPVHLYVEVPQASGPLHTPLYVSAYYADGRPAQGSVEVSIDGQRAAGRTNSYGVAKLMLDHGLGDTRETLVARFVDAVGLVGTRSERVGSNGYHPLRMETSKTLYRQGEAVRLRVLAAGNDGNRAVMLYALGRPGLIASHMVQMSNGAADVEFPYQPEFEGGVAFGAWDGNRAEGRYGYNIGAVHGVIFPDRTELQVGVTPERASYRPGETAAVRLNVRTTAGDGVESALGVAIVDESVLERARTDAAFGERPWFQCRYCADDNAAEIGGVVLGDLYRRDWNKPLPDGLDLVAEVFAARAMATIFVEGEESLLTSQRAAFRKFFDDQMTRLKATLDQRYLSQLDYPRNLQDLNAFSFVWNGLRDPWGLPYTASFDVERNSDVFKIRSSGPDKLSGTEDDFEVGQIRRSYFLPAHRLIEAALGELEDYPPSADEAMALFRAHGIDIDKMRDPWGGSYRTQVRTSRTFRFISILSSGPDRMPDTDDDFSVAEFFGKYFQKESKAIQRALREAARSPQNEAEFADLVRRAGIDLATLRDPWDHSYRIASATTARYGDRRETTTVKIYDGLSTTQTNIKPVTRTFLHFTIDSPGQDGRAATVDDFSVAEFDVLLREESSTEAERLVLNAKGNGTLRGMLLDQTGAFLATGKIQLIADNGGGALDAQPDSQGQFAFTDVPAGQYSLIVNAPGFKMNRTELIPIGDGKTTVVDVVLEVGSVAESVTVTAEAMLLKTESAVLAVRSSGPSSTPRVREYFPETLLWAPELITDAQGQSRVQFKMADTVTNWKVAVIASTVDGRFAESTADVRSFQPFFLDFQPPPILTSGDQVTVPATVRNYQNRAEKVTVAYGKESRTVTVDSDSSTNVDFPLQAGAPTDASKHRVSAKAGRNADAVERTIRVHPDGQEVTRTVGDFVAGPISFPMPIPTTAIANATKGEIRLYPGTLSVLAESVRAVMVMPHGCAEQTISAGWANLIALRYAETIGPRNEAQRAVALKNLSAARGALRSYQDFGGGVRYWETGKEDIAVTAHALQFLIEAGGELASDPDDLNRMVHWLESRQGPDGRWLTEGDGDRRDRGSLLLTALVARSLAAAKRAGLMASEKSLAAAYHHLATLTDSLPEPYMLAQFILAALDSKNEDVVRDAASRLVAMARSERGALYWDLQTNTPFYGWGTAGRMETTGVVVDALAQWRRAHPDRSDLDEAIRHGMVFLLRGRDPQGSWYSTQGTLRAMQAVIAAGQVLGNLAGRGGRVDVRVNGRPLKSVLLPNDPASVDPIVVDISSGLHPGENQIELVPDAGTQAMIVHSVVTHWVPWTQTIARTHDELRLTVDFDRKEASIGEVILAKVKAERVGFSGYGMMLAEIGLPPGLDVDRSSLNEALNAAGVDHYDVLPDRLVLYLWPRAGGTDFQFAMTPRLAMWAKSATSVLYDYYNPDALAEAPPVAFKVRAK